jgi:murein DD-endopeptidase MepM/ murein hydrolase activator NlpD
MRRTRPPLPVYLLVIAAGAFLLATPMRKLRSFLYGPLVLRSDAMGDGNFGARRGGHVHQGTDYEAAPGAPVYSPVAGRVVRFGRPYANDARYRLVEVHGDGYAVKLFYVEPLPGVEPGLILRPGDPIGRVQDLAIRYHGITNHVHVEVRKIVGGQLVNPANVFA